MAAPYTKDEFGVLYPELKHIDENTIEFGETGIKMRGTGYYFFLQGNDLGWLSRHIARFIEMGYEPQGEPFLINGEICQAMLNRPGLHRFWQEVHAAKDAAARAAKDAQASQPQPVDEVKNQIPKLQDWILKILARR